MNTTKGQSINVEALLKDFWLTRPRRPRQGRMVAGVAAGIADRYAIDPVIVRVLLVVTAIYGGAGMLFYLAGWLLLAEENDEVSAGESVLGRGHSSMSQGFRLLLGLLCIPAFTLLFSGPFGPFAGFLGLVALLGGLVLLHQHRAALGVPGTPHTPSTALPVVRGPEMATPATEVVPYSSTPPEPPVTPVDPVFQPTEVMAARRTRKSHVGGITMGVAFLVTAVLAIVSRYSPWLTVGHIVGIVAGILGAGLVVGAFLRGGRGLIVPTALVALAAVALTGWPYRDLGGIRHVRETPVAQLASSYHNTLGTLVLDMTGMKLDRDHPVSTAVSVGVGDVKVIVPAGATVNATCEAGLGTAKCLDQRLSGVGAHSRASAAGPADKNAGTINLTVHVGVGDLEVTSE
ncbi:MAG: PspC domain-containing protein [Kutzneria sp.]|nr:PspC domain-containing protein [Kutzneria sp.]